VERLARCVIFITAMPHSRNLLLSVVLAWIACGCQAAIITAPLPSAPADDAGVVPSDDPEALFVTTVQPLLSGRCASCHEDAARAPAFLDPADYYTSVLTFDGLVVPGDPGSSMLLTKGDHAGRFWDASEASTVLQWIEAEAAGPGPGPGPGPGTIETSGYPVEQGENRIPLTEAGLEGSEIVFYAQRIASGMLLSDVRVIAGGTGAALSAPRFVVHDPAGGSALDDDRFGAVELRIPPGGNTAITSSLVLVDFPIDGDLGVQFAAAGPY
jgi:hypothetical protein